MILVACVEDRMGILFHKRRVSRDRAVYKDILEHCDSYIWMDFYSAELFAEFKSEKVRVDEQCLQKAKQGEWCFVERQWILPYRKKVEKIILYFWNRRYPSDVVWEEPMANWLLDDVETFEGYSHEKITKETYRRTGICGS